MSAPHPILHVIILILLVFTAASCWLGVLGMWRMREPIQGLHYMALPAAVGSITVTLAVFLQTGFTFTGFKVILIAALLAATNAIASHATARAFRMRKLGHWEPRPEDGVEFLSRKEPAR